MATEVGEERREREGRKRRSAPGKKDRGRMSILIKVKLSQSLVEIRIASVGRASSEEKSVIKSATIASSVPSTRIDGID